MARSSQDLYGEFGSVPNSQSVEGSGAHSMSIQANPNDFGAQVGKGIEKVGEVAQGLAVQYGNMVNETLMTNADSALAQKVGQIKGEYLKNTGLAAAAAFPKYQADLEAARQQFRSTLPMGAAHGFDMLSMRSIANHEADGSTYAASQVRQATIDSGTNLSNANVQAVLDPDVAKNPERVQWHQDSAIHGLQMTMDESHPGLKTDPETGELRFDESKPEGVALKKQYQDGVDRIITQTQTNRFNTLAKGDVLGAFGIYQQERDTLPRLAQVQLDAIFEPKVFNAHVNNGTASVIAHSEQDYAQKLYNPTTASDSAISTVLKNEGGLSPDGHAIYGIDKEAHPAEFAKAQQIAKDDGDAAGKKYAADFYKTEYWDKKGISDIPANTQNIVMDGVVNHSKDFGDKLIAAAKEGATPQELVDMRRAEYQRLATENPAKYGEYLAGWNNRLDNLQNTNALTGQQIKSYATNPDGSKMSTADYYRTHSEDVLQRADALSEQQMPGDLAYKRAMRETVSNYMNKTISNQSQQYIMDNKNVMRGINGEFTKGKPPETEAELRSIPGMDDLLNRVSAQDPRFAEGIPTMLAKMARRNDVTNSSNGYDTIIRVLQPQDDDHPNHIKTQNQLDSLLGKSDGTGINMKDYNDAKPITDLPKDSPLKEVMLKTMQEITNANGNLDGKGQERALQWYQQTMNAYKANQSKGDKALPDSDFVSSVGEKDGPPMPAPPSRMQQINNWAKNFTLGKEIPTLTSKDQFDALQSGDVYIRDGQQRRKP